MSHCHTYLNKLRDNGYRITPQREMIVQIIAHCGKHMSAEEVMERVREKTTSVNIATVYRTLDMLVENGLASRFDLGNGKIAYATGKHGPHIHLVCKHCGSITEVSEKDISPFLENIEKLYNFDCIPYHFSVHGLCRDCRNNGSR